MLGGTRFLGPAIVGSAVARGHSVTLFNRGITDPSLFPNLEHLRGFRSTDASDQDLSALADRRFDVAIDVWPSDPAVAGLAAEFLKPRVGQYLYVSSVGAYASSELDRSAIDETARLETWTGPPGSYRRGKAESERRLHGLFGDKVTIVRPGPIKGERDTSPDLYAWLVRAINGGQHIAPGDGTDPVELVDVKDVARFLLLAIERGLTGTFNLTGRSMPFREFLDSCRTAIGSDAEFVWVPQQFLHEHGLDTDFALDTYAGNFPFWRPAGTYPGLYRVSSAKAYEAGWRTRPFEETALDCLEFFRSQGDQLSWSDRLTAAKEREVLSAWDTQRRS